MPSTIALKSPYVALIQKPKCCAATCLQMILYRRGFGLFDQEDLAIELGVKVGADDRAGFKLTMPLMTQFNLDEGISTLSSLATINAILRNCAQGFSAKGTMYSNIVSFTSFVAEAVASDDDVWIEYHSQEVHPEVPINDRIHDGLIEAIDLDEGVVTLLDPNPRRKQRRIVPIQVMERSISNTFGRELGVILVNKR